MLNPKFLAALVLLVAAVIDADAQTSSGDKTVVQAPQGGQPAPATDPRLDQLLARWEQETRSIQQSMAAELRCTRKDHVFNKKRLLTGTVKFMRPDLARVDLIDSENPARYDRYICTGSHIYNFAPAEQTIYVYPLQQAQKGQLPDEGPWQFLSDMRADKIKARYDLKITKATDYYTYIDVFPKFEKDLQDFIYARLVILNKADKPAVAPMVGLPVQLYWVEPNKTEVTWDILKIHRDAPQLVKRAEFEKPELPGRDWKWGDTQRLSDTGRSGKPASSPRVVRPQTPEK